MTADNGFVISTRVRLARNIKGFPYPIKLNDGRSDIIAGKVYASLSGSVYNIYKIAMLNEVERAAFKERHLISQDLINNAAYGSVILNADESVSIMVNEEDHIREQCILSGLKLEEAYNIINCVDDVISQGVEFSYSDKLGYLTSCPTNLGTGMRASVMMFLPGLTLTNGLEGCMNAVSRLNMTVRGVYGEGSEAEGFIYQISNQRSLGVSEKEILDLVMTAVNHFAESEERARIALYSARETDIKDEILRAYGVTANAYKMTAAEMMKNLALIKLGVYYGILRSPEIYKIDKLMTDLQPANLIYKSAGKTQNSEERDILRAYIAGENIKKTVFVK